MSNLLKINNVLIEYPNEENEEFNPNMNDYEQPKINMSCNHTKKQSSKVMKSSPKKSYKTKNSFKTDSDGNVKIILTPEKMKKLKQIAKNLYIKSISSDESDKNVVLQSLIRIFDTANNNIYDDKQVQTTLIILNKVENKIKNHLDGFSNVNYPTMLPLNDQELTLRSHLDTIHILKTRINNLRESIQQSNQSVPNFSINPYEEVNNVLNNMVPDQSNIINRVESVKVESVKSPSVQGFTNSYPSINIQNNTIENFNDKQKQDNELIERFNDIKTNQPETYDPNTYYVITNSSPTNNFCSFIMLMIFLLLIVGGVYYYMKYYNKKV